MPEAQAQSWQRALLMLLPFALWGSAMVAMKPLLVDTSPLWVASLRLLPAGAVLLVVAAAGGRRLPVDRRDIPGLVLFTLVDGALFQALLARGLVQTGAGLGSVLIDSQPLLVALLARGLFGEAINPIGWIGLLIGLLGIVCLGVPAQLLGRWWLEGPLQPDLRAWSHGEPWMLGAAAAMAVGTVLCRFATRHSDPLSVTGWHMLLGGIPLFAVAAWPAGIGIPALWPAWSAQQWWLMGYASLFGSALAYGLFFWFASRGDLTGFSALTFLTPVFALLFAAIWLDEHLRDLQWLGAGLALVSVLLIQRRQRLWNGPAPPPPLAPDSAGGGPKPAVVVPEVSG
jgi:drug/metabolite transporter (DMT)-like permease